MKRLFPLILALLLLTCTLASAQTPAYSPEMTAMKLAVAALNNSYGLTRSSLGLFTVDIIAEGDGHQVIFRPASYLPVERIGAYTVRVTDSTAKPSWTHDAQDAALWQSGSLDSPAWGEKQLQACLNSFDTAWLKPYLADGPEPAWPAAYLDHFEFTRMPSEADTLPPTLNLEDALTCSQALKLADAALMDVFSMSEEEVSALDHGLDAYYLRFADGRVMWDLNIADSQCGFIILVDAVSGEIFDLTLFTGGNG